MRRTAASWRACRARLAEHAQAGAHLQHRGAHRAGDRAAGGRSARSLPARSSAGIASTATSIATGITATAASAPWWSSKTCTLENAITPSTTSASTLSIVCETIVPITTGVVSRGRPARRATISARAGSPRRAGSVADISTPIARALEGVHARERTVRQSGAEDLVPGERAQHHRRAHQPRARRAPTKGSSAAGSRRSGRRRCAPARPPSVRDRRAPRPRARRGARPCARRRGSARPPGRAQVWPSGAARRRAGRLPGGGSRRRATRSVALAAGCAARSRAAIACS